MQHSTKILQHNQTPKSYFPIHPISAINGRNTPEDSDINFSLI